MDLPATNIPETFEEVKEAGPLFHCDLFDAEIVHKIAAMLLLGLSSGCVDNTLGGLFKSPASVAIDVRKEMVEYLTHRSETFVAESVILEGVPETEVSDHPYDIISDFVDDFSSSKRNIFSRVSGWLLSERREDRIDDFVQELEINGFWLVERREAIAQTLLKNVDFKNEFHCNMKFNSAEELAEHRPRCNFRTMSCTNEGCNARFCAAHLGAHDSICPFKILPCEQKCSESIMRRGMDKHCITVCPMKLVNCPFYPAGCASTIPQCTIEQHCLENLQLHLLHVLQMIHKDASVEDLKKRVEQLEESASPGALAGARNVRSLTSAIKKLEAELGPLQVNTINKVREDCTESPNKNGECTQPANRKEEFTESTTKMEEFIDSPNKKAYYRESPTRGEKCNKSPLREEESTTELPYEKEQGRGSAKMEEYIDLSTRKEEYIGSSVNIEEFTKSDTKKEEFTESPTEKEVSTDNNKESTKSDTKKEEFTKSPTEKEVSTGSSNSRVHGTEEVDC